ncbi:MAG: HAD-IA family hydrolase [Quisquiliibacterium sp.]
METDSQPYDLVVFDWDGTLVDSTRAITEAIRLAAADLSLPVPTRETASHVIGLGLLDAIHYAVPDLERARLPAYIERYRYHYLKEDGKLQPFDGIPKLLQELNQTGVCVAIATGKSRAGLNRALEQNPWGGYFVTTRCADEGVPKPDPWMLQDISAETGISMNRMVMIGDTTHDLRMAASAGAQAVAVTYGAHPVEQLLDLRPVACVDDVEQLSAWLLPRVRGSRSVRG